MFLFICRPAGRYMCMRATGVLALYAFLHHSAISGSCIQVVERARDRYSYQYKHFFRIGNLEVL